MVQQATSTTPDPEMTAPFNPPHEEGRRPEPADDKAGQAPQDQAQQERRAATQPSPRSHT